MRTRRYEFSTSNYERSYSLLTPEGNEPRRSGWHGRCCARNRVFKIRRISANGSVLYRVSGRIDEEAVSELQRLFGQDAAGGSVALDLEEVRSVDAAAIEFFARCEESGTELRNCPAYVREWIASSRRQG